MSAVSALSVESPGGKNESCLVKATHPREGLPLPTVRIAFRIDREPEERRARVQRRGRSRIGCTRVSGRVDLNTRCSRDAG